MIAEFTVCGGFWPEAPPKLFDRRKARPASAADAFVVITPEYNHGYPGPLKTAIDSVGSEWHAKPVGFICYGGRSGGLRAVEQLRGVFAELHTVTVRETVSFHGASAQFDQDGVPRQAEAVNTAAGILLDQLAWWACTLREARLVHPYGATRPAESDRLTNQKIR